MVADQPTIVYTNNEKKKEKLKTSKGMDDFYEKWKSKRESMGKIYKKGEKISLNDYLNNNI